MIGETLPGTAQQIRTGGRLEMTNPKEILGKRWRSTRLFEWDCTRIHIPTPLTGLQLKEDG